MAFLFLNQSDWDFKLFPNCIEFKRFLLVHKRTVSTLNLRGVLDLLDFPFVHIFNFDIMVIHHTMIQNTFATTGTLHQFWISQILLNLFDLNVIERFLGNGGLDNRSEVFVMNWNIFHKIISWMNRNIEQHFVFKSWNIL